MSAKRRVKFAGDDDEDESSGGTKNKVTVERIRENGLQIHLGFLQYRHRYHISVSIDKTLISVQPQWDNGIGLVEGSEHCKPVAIESSPCSSDCYLLHTELNAYQDRYLHEEVMLGCGLHLIFTANVLRSDIGTPALRDGVKCIGLMTLDDSDLDLVPHVNDSSNCDEDNHELMEL